MKTIDYLPLEALREAPFATSLVADERLARTFRSSGTTGAERSLVRFSQAGLAAYRDGSVAAFRRVLDAMQAPGGCGLSLIPPPEQWPDSSLAQMVAWIAAEMQVRYVTVDGLREALGALGKQPVWIFGTAFHFVDALDQGASVRLPAGSIIIETGGLKGRTREVSRTEMYRQLATAFGIPEAAIASEYGMCELASQAYDFVPRGETRSLDERRFVWPEWVRARVVTGPGAIADRGRGALLVDDPRRLDAPWPLRTEDLVELDENGFRLLGRVPRAPLKGCSLAAESVRAPVDQFKKNLRTSEGRKKIFQSFRPSEVLFLRPWLESARPRELLADELGSSGAADAALSDLVAGMPKSEGEWRAAVDVATASGACPGKWLFILPENHSVAGIYPLALARAAGLDVTVRLPHRFANTPSFLGAFLEQLSGVRRVGPEVRLGSPACPGHDAVLAYGSDETIAQLATYTDAPVQGYGHRLGVSLIPSEALDEAAGALARDALSLGQTGCMATRLVIASGSCRDPEAMLAALAHAGARFWHAEIPWRALVALDFEALRLERLGFAVRRPGKSGEPLVAYKEVADLETAADAVARAPFTLPVLVVPAAPSLQHLFAGAWAGPLGLANAPAWDGTHMGRPLFVPR